MQNYKSDSELLAEVYRNATLALTSISDILPETEEGEVKEEIIRQHEEYERICSQAASLAKKLNLEIKEPSPIKKAMMWGAIKMNTAVDNSQSNVAAMMIRGTVTGITTLKTSLSESQPGSNEEIKTLMRELIDLEDGFEKRLKKFL